MTDKEKLVSRIQALTEKHKKLDKDIEKMYTTGYHEDQVVHDLKKQKLFLKDEIYNLTTQLENQNG